MFIGRKENHVLHAQRQSIKQRLVEEILSTARSAKKSNCISISTYSHPPSYLYTSRTSTSSRHLHKILESTQLYLFIQTTHLTIIGPSDIITQQISFQKVYVGSKPRKR